MQLNPIDKALGAPAPDNSKKDDDGGPGKKGKKLSPTPAYVLAAIFATLYVVGRILEDRLVRALFKRSLLGSDKAGFTAMYQQREFTIEAEWLTNRKGL